MSEFALTNEIITGGCRLVVCLSIHYRWVSGSDMVSVAHLASLCQVSGYGRAAGPQNSSSEPISSQQLPRIFLFIIITRQGRHSVDGFRNYVSGI